MILGIAQALWLLVAALGVALSVSYAGLPMLGQSAFVGVGGYGVLLLGPAGAGLPLAAAAAGAVLIAGLLGYLSAIGFARLDGGYLALATWALGWLAQRLLFAYPRLFGGTQGLSRPVPAKLTSTTFGIRISFTDKLNLCLAAVICLSALVILRRIGRGPGGLDLAGLRESPAVAESLGVPIAARRRTVLTVTAVLGAIAGVGSTLLLGIISPSDVSPLLSLELFVAVLLGGAARWWAPVLGVAVLTALTSQSFGAPGLSGAGNSWLPAVLTALLLLAVVGVRLLLDARPASPAASSAASPAASSAPVRPRFAQPASAQPRVNQSSSTQPLSQPPGGPLPAPAPAVVELELVHASVTYAGVLALDDVSVRLLGGQVHALIGPNGSGKSSLLQVLAGELAAGTVRINGRPQRGRSVPERALAGVVRTPQHATVPLGLTPASQVALGARGGDPAGHQVLRQLFGTPRSRLAASRLDSVVAAALATSGLAGLANSDPSRLGTGERQLLQIARAVATGASVLLFDEPAAGMAADERRLLASILRGLADAGAAVLVVEHDFRFVAAVADRVTVLDGGRIIAAGSPADVRADPAVRAAFLGSS